MEIAARQHAGAPVLDRADVPESLSATIGQALSLDPARRPATAAAFAAALGGRVRGRRGVGPVPGAG